MGDIVTQFKEDPVSKLSRLSTRRCRNIFCKEAEPHDSHLTLIGRWRYRGNIGLLLREKSRD